MFVILNKFPFCLQEPHETHELCMTIYTQLRCDATRKKCNLKNWKICKIKKHLDCILKWKINLITCLNMLKMSILFISIASIDIYSEKWRRVVNYCLRLPLYRMLRSHSFPLTYILQLSPYYQQIQGVFCYFICCVPYLEK